MSSDPLSGPILALILFLALHGWLNYLSAALRALNEPHLRQEAEDGKTDAERLLPLLDAREEHLHALHLFCTLTALLCGAMSVYAAARPIGNALSL